MDSDIVTLNLLHKDAYEFFLKSYESDTSSCKLEAKQKDTQVERSEKADFIVIVKCIDAPFDRF